MTDTTKILIRIGWRSFQTTVASYAFGAVAYVFLLLWLYPSIVHAPGIETLLKTLPKSLITATGVAAGLGSPLAYVTSEFYGMLYLWILMIFTVMGVVRLLAQGPDRGSAGPWLAGPVSRVQWILSQGFVFMSGLFLVDILITVAIPIAMTIWEPQQPLPIGILLTLNGMGFLLFSVLAGVIALCSAGFSDDQSALSVGALIVMVEYALSLISELTPRLAWMRHLSLFSLYRPAAIVAGKQPLGWTAIFLIIAAGILWAIAAWLFQRRDLPL